MQHWPHRAWFVALRARRHANKLNPSFPVLDDYAVVAKGFMQLNYDTWTRLYAWTEMRPHVVIFWRLVWSAPCTVYNRVTGNYMWKSVQLRYVWFRGSDRGEVPLTSVTSWYPGRFYEGVHESWNTFELPNYEFHRASVYLYNNLKLHIEYRLYPLSYEDAYFVV